MSLYNYKLYYGIDEIIKFSQTKTGGQSFNEMEFYYLQQSYSAQGV